MPLASSERSRQHHLDENRRGRLADVTASPQRSETIRAGPDGGRGHHRAPVRRTVTLRAPHPGSADHDVPRVVGTDAAGTRLTGEQARARVRVRVEGVVQGVGYRPFVHALAAELGVAGFVGNDVDGVFAEAEGASGAVGEFVTALRERAPALAVVERVTADAMPPTGDGGFVIAPSTTGGRRRTLISADTATCVDCLRELTDPADRRFHAQPVCCPDCGPALVLTDAAGAPVVGDPVAAAAAELRSGRILAITGLGGYHLAVDAVAEPAVATLRARKHREERPLAVMAADLEAARTIAGVGEVAASLLTGRRRPIVLLPRRPDAPLAPAVAPRNREIGVMLPYTPLHHLLAREIGRPFVLTSGNRSDEPIAFDDADAQRRLADIADGFLRHDCGRPGPPSRQR